MRPHPRAESTTRLYPLIGSCGTPHSRMIFGTHARLQWVLEIPRVYEQELNNPV